MPTDSPRVVYDGEDSSIVLLPSLLMEPPPVRSPIRRPRFLYFFLATLALYSIYMLRDDLASFLVPPSPSESAEDTYHVMLHEFEVLDRRSERMTNTVDPYSPEPPPPPEVKPLSGAAAALQCRESVVNFVINATDTKDECDGLKKAFDKTCSNDGDPMTRHRRRAREKSWAHQTVLRWLQGLFRDDTLELEHFYLPITRIRRLEEKPKTNVTTTSKSLSVPTSSAHVSEKVLSETLLLQQGDKLVEKATNQSVATPAQKDAAASTQALAEANAAFTAILNDPTTVEVRTCCASILNVYHENCSPDEAEDISDSRLFFIVFVIACCGMVKSLIRHYRILWLPEAAGCIIVGVLSGYGLMFFPHHDISFDGNWFLRIMVPPIVFEAALNIDKRAFNRHIVPILMYAVIGTLVATVLTATIVHQGSFWLRDYCTPVPYVEALTFGALISSIDPIAVLSVLSNMGMTDTDTIYVVIFGESLLNDGVAIVLFQTLVHFLDETLVIDQEAVAAGAVHFLVVAFGSLLVGVAAGMVATIYYWAFHGCQTPLVEILMFVCWALLPYYVCDGIGWSGIVSAVATGFIMDLYIVGQVKADEVMTDDSEDHRETIDEPKEHDRRNIFSHRGHLSQEARTHIGFVTEMIATMMETAIFAYLGLFLFSHRYHWNIWHALIAIAACCISRGVMIPTLSLLANWIVRIQQNRATCQRGCLGTAPANPAGVVIDRKMQLVLWFAGLRGAMSFALVEHVPLYDSVSGEGTRLKPELKAMTSTCILFTVFILGGYTYYVMERLGLSPNQVNKQRQDDIELASLISKNKMEDDDGEMLLSKAMNSGRKAFRRAARTSGLDPQ